MLKFLIVLMSLGFMPASSFGADDMLMAIPGQTAPPAALTNIQPGMAIYLPDGRQTVIEEVLPGGEFRTRLGQVISPQGVILSGPNQGEHIVVEGATANPNVQVNIPDNSTVQAPPAVEVPKTEAPAVAEAPKTEIPDKTQVVETPVVEKEGQTVPEWKRRALEEKQQKTLAIGEKRPNTPPVEEMAPKTTVVKEPAKAAEPEKSGTHRITIAEMLPTTRVPAKTGPTVKEPEKPEAAKKEESKKPEAKKPEKHEPEPKKVEKPEPKKPEPKKPEPKKPEPKKAEKPEAKKPPYEKPKVGQEMRIPPDAAAKGDLTFLNGCWQGTRPEYFSKRTIRECFCFDTNGTGKRRVIDPSGHRMCIGASKAHLSKDGVLSVTSSGAACTDGERWGSAEMVCRNSGPKTPCAWVFRDANNGRQSYTIPFIRVESCGR